MFNHTFIFQPGLWEGEGTIAFSHSSEKLAFSTRWEVEEGDVSGVTCIQEVKMVGADENVTNKFTFSELTPKSFEVALENDLMGSVLGKGVVDEKLIAWEFRADQGMEGYEVYELQEDGQYSLRAEYASPDQFKTIIRGTLRLVKQP